MRQGLFEFGRIRNLMADNRSGKNLYLLIHQQDIDEAHLALISKVRMLAEQHEINVCCIKIGRADEKTASELALYGADSICFIQDPVLAKYSADSSEFYVEALAQLMGGEIPGNIFCCDSLADKDLAGRLAARLGAGLITGCVDLSRNEQGSMVYDKPAYLGRLIGTFTSPMTALDIITVKAGSLEKIPCDMEPSPEIRVFKPELDFIESSLKTLDRLKADPEQIGLDEASIIVSGGRGMASAENFKLLYQLAGLLGGTVAGSLGAVDEGWIPHSRLVGQTGSTVEPKLYIACGVSGSIYHLMGMRDSKTIVAINKDRFAPIFKYADLGMVGDAMTILPAIIERLMQTANKARMGTG